MIGPDKVDGGGVVCGLWSLEVEGWRKMRESSNWKRRRGRDAGTGIDESGLDPVYGRINRTIGARDCLLAFWTVSKIKIVVCYFHFSEGEQSRFKRF
jgi:hypothetical protein